MTKQLPGDSLEVCLEREFSTLLEATLYEGKQGMLCECTGKQPVLNTKKKKKKTQEREFSIQTRKYSNAYWKMSKDPRNNDNIVSKSSLFLPKSSLTYIYTIISQSRPLVNQNKTFIYSNRRKPFGAGDVSQLNTSIMCGAMGSILITKRK